MPLGDTLEKAGKELKEIEKALAKAKIDAKDHKKVQKELDALRKEIDKTTAAAKAAVEKMKAEDRKSQAVFVKRLGVWLQAYMDVVKKSDGLTSARPSITKNLDKISKKPDEKAAADARKALVAQAKEVAAGAKSDPKAAQTAKALIELTKKF